MDCGSEWREDLTLENIKYLILSHRYYDHSGGIIYININQDSSEKSRWVAHPDALQKKFAINPLNPQSDGKLSLEKIKSKFIIKLTIEALVI